MSEIPAAFDAPVDGLRGRAAAGAMQTGLAQGVRLLVQIGSVVVLSRLLAPSEFGLVAMAGPVVGFAALFQDLGLTQAVVQKPTVTQAELSALFTIGVGIGLALALLLILTAPLASWFYGERRVGLLTAAMGLNVILGSLGALQYALLNRRMAFGTLAALDALSATGGLAAAALTAWLTHSFWALYVGGIVSGAIPVAGYWWLSGWRPSLPRRGSGAGAALRFGANVTGFNVANFFSRNLDNVLIGAVWGERPLGLYDRAYKLLLLPLQQINNPLSKVMLPVLSQMAAEPERYRRAYLRTLSQVLLITLPGVAFMIATADVLVPTLLGPQWAEAAPIFSVLGAASLLQVLNNPTGWLFLSQGRSRDYLTMGLFGAATCVVAFVVGLPYGPLGVATAYAISEYVRTPVLWWFVGRRGPVKARDAARMALPHYAGAVASLAAVWMLRPALPDAPVAILVCGLLASYAASGLVIAAFPGGRAALRAAMELARGYAGRIARALSARAALR